MSTCQLDNRLYVIVWLKENFRVGSAGSMRKSYVYRDYLEACREQGLTNAPISHTYFGKLVRRAFLNIRCNRKGPRGDAHQCYTHLERMREPKTLDAAEIERISQDMASMPACPAPPKVMKKRVKRESTDSNAFDFVSVRFKREPEDSDDDYQDDEDYHPEGNTRSSFDSCPTSSASTSPIASPRWTSTQMGSSSPESSPPNSPFGKGHHRQSEDYYSDEGSQSHGESDVEGDGWISTQHTTACQPQELPYYSSLPITTTTTLALPNWDWNQVNINLSANPEMVPEEQYNSWDVMASGSSNNRPTDVWMGCNELTDDLLMQWASDYVSFN